MNCDEIKISLHDYIDEQLDLMTKKEVKDHLYKCERCFGEYQRLQDFFNCLKRLPYTLEPIENIIDEFSKDLLKQDNLGNSDNLTVTKTNKRKIKRELKKQEERLKAGWSVEKKSKTSQTIINKHYSRRYQVSKTTWRKIIFIPIIMVILSAAYFVYDFQKRNSPWIIEKISSKISVNGKLTETGRIAQGESFSTEDNLKGFLLVPKVGKVELMPNSSIFIEKAKDDDNRIKIEKGSIRVINSVDMPELAVVIHSVTVYDKSGIFTIKTDQKDNAVIFVETGFVEINSGEKSLNVKEGYVCEIKNGNSFGLPYRIDVADSLKKIIEKFDDSVNNELLVNDIISLAGNEDMLTLLALIPRASQQQRQILFQKIANHYQPPTGVTRMGILRDDEEMLYMWWEEIEWQL